MDFHFVAGGVLSHGAGSHGNLATRTGAGHGRVGAGTGSRGVQAITVLKVHPHGDNPKCLRRFLVSYPSEKHIAMHLQSFPAVNLYVKLITIITEQCPHCRNILAIFVPQDKIDF